MCRIWLIGGTRESADCAKVITSDAGIPCTITVTTPNAVALYYAHPLLQVRVGAMDYNQVMQFCLDEQITAIVDASHPFAQEITQNAINYAKSKSLPYLRYERRGIIHSPQANILELDSFSTLLWGNYLEHQRVLLTIGYKNLPLFQSWHQSSTLFARILPLPKSLAVALAAGFSPERIIAVRPPVSLDLEKALWRQWEISLVVTKANGSVGGEDTKIRAAQELGITLIVIARPDLSYPEQTSNLLELGKWVQKNCRGASTAPLPYN